MLQNKLKKISMDQIEYVEAPQAIRLNQKPEKLWQVEQDNGNKKQDHNITPEQEKLYQDGSKLKQYIHDLLAS